MKVLISVFQVFVMVLVVLFSIGTIEVVSYRTVNIPLARDIIHNFFISEVELAKSAMKIDLFQNQQWSIRFINRPYWLNSKN